MLRYAVWEVLISAHLNKQDSGEAAGGGSVETLLGENNQPAHCGKLAPGIAFIFSLPLPLALYPSLSLSLWLYLSPSLCASFLKSRTQSSEIKMKSAPYSSAVTFYRIA